MTFLLLIVGRAYAIINFIVCISSYASPEGNSREPVSWSSEENSVSRGNFLGKMQSVREARVVRSTGSELREGVGGCGGSGDWGGRREEGGGRR